MTGKIYSFESFGTVDGPGIRFVVFVQGCPMRCLYCHNPDTWSAAGGTQYTAEEVASRILKYKNYFTGGGGATVSGGEPLMQAAFVEELFTILKKSGIHTALDTSGALYDARNPRAFDSLLAVTDLVLLDIKHIDDGEHIKLTGRSNKNILAFARYLSDLGKPVWIRHVVVPGITFEKEELTELGRFLKTLSNVEKLEVLPYHALGKVKYDNLGIDYVLKDTPQLTKEQAKEAERIIRSAMEA